MSYSLFLDRSNGVDKEGLFPINFDISHNSKRLRPSTGIKVHPNNWDDEQKIVKRSDPDHRKKNEKLSNHMDFFDKLLVSPISNEAIKAQYKKFKDPNYILPSEKGVLAYFNEFIEESRTRVSKVTNKLISEATIKQYKNTRDKLSDFITTGFDLTPKKFDFEFEKKFKKYILIDLGQEAETYSKHIKNIKLFCSWLLKSIPDLPRDYEEFERPIGESEDAEPLTSEELLQWHNVCFLDKPLEKARLIFLTLVSTAIHISDYNESLAPALSKKYTEEGHEFLILYRKKTTSPCIIPYFDDQLFRPVYYINLLKEKYGELPYMTGNNLNYYIACIQYELGQIRIKATTKTGRKTHASIKVYDYGLDPELVMKTTGHETRRSFDAYLGIRKSDIVKEMFKKARF